LRKWLRTEFKHEPPDVGNIFYKHRKSKPRIHANQRESTPKTEKLLAAKRRKGSEGWDFLTGLQDRQDFTTRWRYRPKLQPIVCGQNGDRALND
jgi:hypothetical protein